MGYLSNYRKKKEEEEEKKSVSLGQSGKGKTSSLTSYRAKKRAGNEFGLDTLESDLHTMGETLNNIYGSWQTKETMDNTFESVNKMYNRLVGYQDYYTQYGKESGLPDLSELLNTYKNAVDKWGERTELYGNYQNADAFNKAVKDYQLSEKFKGLSYGDVQARMRRYSPDSDEYNYLKNYTGYTSTEDFDKAIAGLSTDIGIYNKANEYEGRISSYEGQADKFKKRTNGLTNDGGYGKKADDTRVEYNAWLAENGFDSGNALKAEYADEVKLAKELGKAKNIYELDNSTADKYKYLEKNDDFAEHSQYDSSVNEGKKPHYQPFTNYDIKYDYINNVPEIRDSYERKAGNKDAGTAFSDNGWEYLTEKELAYYNYLHYLDGQNGTKKSDKFLEDLKPALQKRYSEKASERRAEMLENPFAATAFSLASPIMTIAGGIGNLIATGKDIVTGSEYNPYDPLREISNANAHGREVVSQNIAEATKGFELFGQNIASFLYNTGESVLDTVVGGSAFGHGYTALMGTNAYQQKAKELTEQGYDATTVQGLAITSGVLEMAFEYAGFDHLMKLKDADSIGKVIYNALVSQGGAEGLEELGTSIGNMIAEYGFLGEDSQYMKKYNDLIARGFSEKEASIEVAKAMASEIAWSYAGGWLSGAGLGAGTSVGQYTQNKAVGKDLRGAEQIGDVLNIASMTPQESEAYKAYTAYANKGVTADNITDAQLGNLYNTMSSEAEGGLRTANKDLARAKKTIEKQEGIIESKTFFEEKKAQNKLDKAVSNYDDAQTRLGKYAPIADKLSGVEKSVYESGIKKAIEKAEAEKKAKHEAEVKKLSSGVETSVMADTDKAIEIKGMKDSDTLITSDGEVKLKDVELSDRDADLVAYARGMEASEASLYLEQYDGKADIEQYTNDFNRVVEYSKHAGFTQDYILEHKGNLSTDQVNAIYSTTVIEEARLKEAEHNKLIAATANGTPYNGYIDDSIIKKIGWNKLDQRQRASVDFLKAFATKAGMNLVFEGYSEKTNGVFNIKDNTIHVSVYAGILFSEGKLRDTIIPTASHEITHWMEEKSPELYVKLKDTVLNALEVAMGKSQADIINEEIARLDREHRNKKHTAKDAINEIVARSCEDMLAMSKEGRKLFDSMTDDEKKTFVDKVKEIVANLKKWIDEFLSSYKADTDEAIALRDYKDKLEEISKIWDEMLVRSIEVNQALEKADVFGNLTNGVSKDGTTIVGENNLQMSDKTYREGGRDFLVNWLDGQKGISEEDKLNIIEQTDRVAELMRIIDRGGEIPEYSRWANLEVVKDESGEKVLSVIVKNGDYAMNIDFSQVCKKRVALDAVLNAMVQQGVLDVINLSETDMADLNAIIKKHDFEIACALCFVDAKRYRVNAWAESFCEGSDEKKSGKWVHKYGFNEMVRSLIPKGSNIKADEFNFTNRDIKNQPTKSLLSEADDSELDFSLIDKIMAENDSKNAQHRYAKAIKENPEIRKILNSAEIISSIGLDAIRLESPKLYGLINGHQGTAKPKFSHSMVAYGNDVLKASNFTPEKAKMVGGVRCQSFSDFMASMVVDYAQFISELSAKGLTSHSYTKEPLFVKLFGLTGMKINMSLVPKAIDMTPEQQKRFAILKDKNANKKSKEYKEALAEYEKLSENAGLDENGNYIWEDETFPYDIAMEIVVDRRYSKNCGTIAVGISDNHIRKLLADDRISMVIPYHKSGLNHEVAMMRDIALYKDYTDYQNTRDKRTGKKLDSKKGQVDFDFYGDLYGKDGKEGTHDPKQTAENYKRWCYENNYIPKFDDFMLDANYYKLLIDFRVYDVDGTYAEQQPVMANYPSNDEFKDLILNGVKDKNGKVYGGLKQQQSTSDRLDAESQQIINEYKQRLKEKYGEDVLQYSDKKGKIKKAEELSETDLRYLLENVQYGVLEDSSYIPLRATTPEFFIDVVREHSEGKINVMNVPMAAAVEHMRQNMEEEEGLSYGEHRPHNFDVDDIVTISKEMGHPAYIVLQENERYAMVVSFYNKAKKKVVVSISFADDNKDKPKNFKHLQYMNGYNAGYYNIVVTQYEPDDLSSYLKSNEVVYDKQKMNGRYQVGSGRIVTFTHDTPFIENTVSHSDGEINEEFVNNDDLQYSDKKRSSTYDLMGEAERIVKENKKLGEDVDRFKQIIGTDKVENKKFLSLAHYMKKLSGSTMDSVKLANMLKDAYTSMQNSESLSWEDVLLNTHNIASSLMTGDLKVSVDYFKRAMYEIRKDKISLSAKQLERVQERFGNYGNFHKYVFGRVNVTNDGKPLADVWKAWAKIYPSLFDASVQESDQVDALIEAVDTLKSTNTMMEEYERAEAVRHLSTELYNQFWNIASQSSSSEQAKGYRAEHKSMMEELRKGYEQRQKALAVHPVGETALKYENLLKKVKERKQKEVAEAKELGRQRMAEYKENAQKKTKIQSITSMSLDLNRKLVTNSKDVHVPEPLKPIVINLLNAIDFSSKQLLGTSERYRELHLTPNKADATMEKTLNKVHSMNSEEIPAVSLKKSLSDALKLFESAKDVLNNASDGTVDSSIVALDKDLVEDIEKAIANLDARVEKGETTFVLQEMSVEDLETLRKMISSIKHWASVSDKVLQGRHKKRISDLSLQTINETAKFGNRQEYIKGIEDVKNFFNWSNLLPVNAFKRLGDAATEFFNGLRDSQDKVTFNRQEVMDFTDELLKKYKAYNPLNWRTEVKTFDVKLPGETDATKVTMPVSYIMTLYCVAKQEDAQRHLYGKDENGNKLTYTDEKGNVHDGGGMTIKGFKEGKLTLKVNKSLDNTIVNESIVKQITSVLTKEQIEVADALQKYMNDKGSEWGNAVSMALYGIKKFAVKDYFPITVNPHTLSADKIRDAKQSFFSILNYGFAKERNPKAKQSIEIGDIFEIFTNHMNMLAIYNAYALSVFDIARWYNFKDKNEKGKEISVTASIEKAFGKGALTYVSNLIKDLNGQHEPSRLGFISELFKNTKVAMVGNSISVALLQPTAYLKAMVKIPPKYLLKSALHIKDFGASNGVRKAKKYCGIALLKSQGYFETGVSANTATKMMHDESLKEKLTEWSLKGAEWMDERTWGALWNACEFMIRDARKDLKVGSEEFYHAVADKLRDVIYETQVVDSPLTKSDLMRSGDTGAKMVTMFASEMTVAYNMVFESAFQTHLDSKRYGLKNALKKNAKNLYMTFMAYTLTSVANAALSAFVDSFRYGSDDDEEDENEFLNNFLSDWIIVGKIPYFKEIISFSQGYSSSRTDTLWLESAFKAYEYWNKVAEGKDGATMKAFDETLKSLSYASGYAIYNQWRDLRAMLKFIGIME